MRLQVHQLVRELTYGIYAFNQLPAISLEPNNDMTSTCQMSPVYHDTRVGRLLTEVDATLKCLWHGVCFPRDKRLKFADRWRSIVEANVDNTDSLNADKDSRNQLLAEFINAGILALYTVFHKIRTSLFPFCNFSKCWPCSFNENYIAVFATKFSYRYNVFTLHLLNYYWGSGTLQERVYRTKIKDVHECYF